MQSKTATNLTTCDYCGGVGYFEIHNAYDHTDITLEVCPKCMPNPPGVEGNN